MSVKALIEEIIEIEGGYVNHKADRGGATKYGITHKTLAAWRNKYVTDHDVSMLEKSEAFDIYESEYYLKPRIYKLPELIRPVVFDMAVNMGPKTSVEIMQGIVHKIGLPIKIDGAIGPMTVQSAKTACNLYGENVLRQITTARIEHYRAIVRRDPSQRVFLAGWINRANKFKDVRVA